MSKHHTGAAETLDELQSVADRLGAFLQSNLRTVTLFILLLLVIAGAVSLVVSSRRRAETDASIALADARADYLQAMGAPPGALEVPKLANPEAAKKIREEYEARYAKIADEHGGTVSGALARLEAAELQLEASENDAALETLRAASAQAPSRPSLQGVILQREAQVLEQADRFAEAAALHEQAAGLAGYPLRDYALADAARCRATAGETDKARELYARLDKQAPDLQLPDYQRMQRREIESTGPEPAPAPAEKPAEK
jgi:predicted negative regulator of RcsB-dependent stress response